MSRASAFRSVPLQLSEVPLARIDREDRRFQHRIGYGVTDLVDSLRERGQLVPITLWGAREPYLIIDGFRRVEALQSLGIGVVQAVVRENLDEKGALGMSFTENVRRRNFSTLDKAHAVWVCANRHGMKNDQIAREFELSERQVHRYRQLLDLPPVLVDAIKSGRVSMAHAIEMRGLPEAEIAQCMQRLEAQGPSALHRGAARRPRGARPRLLLKEGSGYRLRALHFRPAMDRRAKEELLEALDRLAGIVRENLKGEPAAAQRGPERREAPVRRA